MHENLKLDDLVTALTALSSKLNFDIVDDTGLDEAGTSNYILAGGIDGVDTIQLFMYSDRKDIGYFQEKNEGVKVCPSNEFYDVKIVMPTTPELHVNIALSKEKLDQAECQFGFRVHKFTLDNYKAFAAKANWIKLKTD